MAELRILTVRDHYFVNHEVTLRIERKVQNPSIHFHRVEPLDSNRPSHAYPPVKMDRPG